MKKIIIILMMLFFTTNLYAGDISRSHSFLDGEVLTAALLNTAYDEIVNEANDLDGDNLASNIAITTSGNCTFSGTNTLSGATTVSGNLTTTGTNNLIGNGGSDILTLNTPGGITYTPAATWTFTGSQTVSGTWANAGTMTTVDINGGTWQGTIDGNWTAASQTCANLGTVTTTGTFGLGGKLTAGSNEIEGSNFDITGGSITGITDLVVADGGTGASTLTDGGILVGSGTDAITALGVATNGQIPIGDGTTDPVLATITGTANEVDVTNAAGSITIGIVNPLAIAKGGTGSTTGMSQLFTSDGNWTAPVGVTQVYITMVGGGGNGGNGSSDANGGGGGGGGESVIKMPYTVVAESIYAVDVGAAAANSTFNSTGVVASAGTSGGTPTAGVGGGALLTGATGADGGAGGGSHGFKGGDGGVGKSTSTHNGGGGGGSYFGTGGAGGAASNGTAGTGYGAGGGGGGGYNSSYTGGSGTAGFVLVEW